MKRVLIFAAIAEAVTGLALLIVPPLVGQLLLGEALTGVIALKVATRAQPLPPSCRSAAWREARR
jgi:hypothetical protein